jgi:hypothetical protein
MKKPKPCCQEARQWIAGKYGRNVFAPFTGQDAPAFSLFVHAVQLYLYGDMDGRLGALEAMRGALRGMQSKCWWLCKAAIPAIGDWGHEAEIWDQLGEEFVVEFRSVA